MAEVSGSQEHASNIDAEHRSRPAVVELIFQGETYSLPWNICKTWPGIERLIASAHRREAERKQSTAGGLSPTSVDQPALKYDLVDSDGGIIMPEVWEDTVSPGITVTVRLWSDLENDRSSLKEHLEGNDPSVRNEDLEDLLEPAPPAGESDCPHDFVEEWVSDVSKRDYYETPKPQTSSYMDTYTSTSSTPFIRLDNPTNFHPFQVPRGTNGKKLSFDVEIAAGIETQGLKTPKLHWPQNHFSVSALNTTSLERLDVHAARVSGDSGSSLELLSMPGPQRDEKEDCPEWRWLHIQRECTDFDTLKAFALNTPELKESMIKVIHDLLEKVEQKNFVNGRFVEPATVIRADGPISGDESGKETAGFAIFLCFPYLEASEQERKRSVENRSSDLHPSRTLLQSFYPWESTRERDREQALPKYHGGYFSGQAVHVPHLWAIQINEDALITCGKMTKDSLCGPSVHSKSIVPSFHITDQQGQPFLLDFGEYETLLEIEDALLQHLGPAKLETAEDYYPEVFKMFSSNKPQIHRLELKSTNKPPMATGEKIPHDSTTFGQAVHLSIVDEKLSPEPSKLGSRPFFTWDRDEDDESKTIIPEGCITDNLQLNEAEMVERLNRHDAESSVFFLKESASFEQLEFFNAEFGGEHFYQRMRSKQGDQIQDILAFSESAAERASNSAHQRLPISEASSWSAICFSAQKDLIMSKQNQLLAGLQQYTVALQGLLETFAPKAFISKSEVFGKVFGETYHLADVVLKSQVDFPTEPQGKWVILADCSTMEALMQLPKEKKPPRRHSRFQICRSSVEYEEADKAIEHLKNRHFPRSNPIRLPLMDTMQTSAELAYYVSNTCLTPVHDRLDRFNGLIGACLETVEKLRLFAESIHVKVSQRNGGRSPHAKLSDSFFLCFEVIMAFVFAAQKAAQHIESMYANGKLGNSDVEFAQLRTRLSVMEMFGRAAQDDLSEAQEIFTERLIPRPMAGLSKHIAFGPSLLVAWIMRSLVVRDLSPKTPNTRATVLYTECFQKLRYETNHHPRKRLLRDINLLEEELNAILRVVDWQREAIQSFMAVLDHRSYQKANGKRQARYAVEQNVLISALRPLATYVSEYRYLAGLCPSLSKKTKQSTEINEEDHGKAILVFTIVTAIFLPLSFVTSFLGMNTTDIRDTGYDQSLFWIISLPLTVTIMALILGIAYNGDDLRAMLSDFRRTGRLTQGGTRYKDELIQVGNRRVASSSTNPFSGNSGQGDKSFAGGTEFESPFVAEQNPFSSTGSLNRPRGQHRSRQQPPHRPTYVKVHRDHIAIETLTYYNLPWEWDQTDPDYIIILREMDARETDILFEHTRRVRSNKKTKGTPARFFGKP